MRTNVPTRVKRAYIDHTIKWYMKTLILMGVMANV